MVGIADPYGKLSDDAVMVRAFLLTVILTVVVADA